MNSTMKTLFSLTPLALLLVANTASASPEFQSELKDVAAMDCTPSCTVCHTTNPGQAGTASMPFAISMTDPDVVGSGNTLVPGDEESLVTAYMNLPDDHDSDEDGIPDKEELESEGASDPSVAGVGAPCAAEVKYGCGAQIAQGETPARSWIWPLLLAGFASALAFARRSRA